MVPVPDRPPTGALTAIGRRALEGLLTAWAAVTLTFFTLRLAGGDPVAGLLSQGLAGPEQAEALRRQLGLNDPLLAQYARFLQALLRADLGESLYTNQPVVQSIAEQLPATVQLAGASLLVAILLGVALGVLAARGESSILGRAAAALAGLATSLPVAATGVAALLLFSWGLRAAPRNAVLIAMQQFLLPALVLGYAVGGPLARVVHAGLRETLTAPFFVAARARGIPRGPRLLWHALRPALPPAVSLGALEAAFLFSGTVVTETVFSRPGVGRLLIRAILQGDFPVAQGVVIAAAFVYTGSQFLADVVNLLLDPRLRREA